MTLRPVQPPHPPLWFGISHPGRADWAAANEVNVVALLPAGMVSPITDAYRAAWEARGRAPRTSRSWASRASSSWPRPTTRRCASRGAPTAVVREHQPAVAQHDVPSPLDGVLPEDFADWHAAGAGFAGTPAKAIEYIAAQEAEAGINYFCADLIFGDITFEEASRTVELFESDVIPAFNPAAAKSARLSRVWVSSRARPSASPMRRVSSRRSRLSSCVGWPAARAAAISPSSATRSSFNRSASRADSHARQLPWPAPRTPRRHQGGHVVLVVVGDVDALPGRAAGVRTCSAARRIRSRRERRR